MISQGEGCREDVGGGWQHTRQTLEKSPTSKLYTTWAHILSDRNKFAPWGEGENGGVQFPRGFSCFPFFLVVTCPRPPVFARPNILVASFTTRLELVSWVTIISFTPRGEGGGERRGVMPLGLFLFNFEFLKDHYRIGPQRVLYYRILWDPIRYFMCTILVRILQIMMTGIWDYCQVLSCLGSFDVLSISTRGILWLRCTEQWHTCRVLRISTRGILWLKGALIKVLLWEWEVLKG